MLRLLEVFAVLLLLAAAPLAAQTDACLHRTVAVSVFDDRGEIVTGLTAENFQASLRHERVKILSVRPGDSPRVVIVLDASGSMLSRSEVWDFSIDAATQLSRSLPTGALLGMVVFSTQVGKTVPLSADRQTILAALRRC